MICENEEFKIEAEEKKGCLLDVKVEIKAKKAESAYKKALKTINKEISIPGFRKGKVPDSVIISKYGAHIEKEWKDILVNDAFQATLDLTLIHPLTKRSIKKASLEKHSKEGALVSLAYEFHPKVPFIDLKNLSLSCEAIKEVNDSDIEEAVKELQESHAQWETITDRSIEENDFVNLSITAVEGEQLLVNERRFHLSDSKISPWLKNSVLGHLTGEVVEAETEEDPRQKVRIQIHAIQKALLPDIDDAFATKLGADSLNNLKEKIRSYFIREYETRQSDSKYRAAKEAMIEKYPFELPASFVLNEVQERKKAKIEKLKANLSPEEIQQQEVQLEKEAETEAEKSIRLFFINQQLARQGNLVVTREEVNDELKNSPFLKGEPISEDLFSRVSNQMFQRKLKEYTLSQIEN